LARITNLRTSVENSRPFEVSRLPVGAWLIQANTDLIAGDRHDVAAWQPYELYCSEPGSTPATAWDYYAFQQSSGLFSKRAIDVLGSALSRCFTLLPSTLEGEPYYFLHCRAPIDCLVRDASKINFFPEPDDDKVLDIEAYVFDVDQVEDPLIFALPEQPFHLFATESIPKIVRKAKLKGFRFDSVAQSKWH